MQQVRQGLYVTAIGKWVKYKKQLEPIRKLLLPRLKEMLAKGQLPFANQINWLLDPNHDYLGEGAARVASEPKTVPDSLAADTPASKTKKATPRDSVAAKEKSKPPTSSPSPGVSREKAKSTTAAQEPEEPRKKTRRRAGSAKGSGKKKAKRQGKSSKKRPRGSQSIKENSSRKKASLASKKRAPRDRQPRPSKRSTGSSSSKPSRASAPLVSRQEITALMTQIKSSFPAEVLAHLAAIRSSLPYRSDDGFLDELSAMTVALYNLGKLKECIQFSQQVLLFNRSLHSVAVALSSALAMDGKLEESLLAMNSLIHERTRDSLDIGSDVYERRAQVLLALGDTNASIADLTKAIKIAPNANSYMTRASAFIR